MARRNISQEQYDALIKRYGGQITTDDINEAMRQQRILGNLTNAANTAQQMGSALTGSLRLSNGEPVIYQATLPQLSTHTSFDIQKPIKKEKQMMGFAKDYLEKHKDTVMTVVVVLLIDYFFLGGALRAKIKKITEDMLDGVQKKLSHAPAAEAPKDAA